MATTTNYGWTTPDDTALVKDGAAAIRTLGTSVDTTTKNLNPSTTLGDIEYRSSTPNVNTRLGIGSDGDILTVASGVPSWTAPAGASGLTLVTSGTFTTSSAVNISDCFSATYTNYKIVLTLSASTNNVAIDMRLRVAGANNTDSDYDSQNVNIIDTSVVGASYVNQNRWAEVISAFASGYFTSVEIFMANPFATDYTGGQLVQSTFASSTRMVKTTAFAKEATTSFTGLGFIPSAGTISGSYKVYGLAN